MKAFSLVFLSILSFFLLLSIPVRAQTTTKPQITLKEVKPVEGGKIQTTITWDSVASNTHYYEVYSKTGASDYELLGNLDVSPVILTYSENTQFFTIKVREITSQGPGPFSNELFVQWNRTPLGVPKNVSIQDVKTTDTSVEATIKWSTVVRATKYYVYTVIDGKKQKIGEAKSTESPITYSKFGNSFNIAISAANDISESSLSEVLTIKREQYVVPTTPPTPTPKTVSQLTNAPQNVRIISQTIEDDKKNIEIVWDNMPQSVGYYIYISTDEDFSKLTGVMINSIVLSVPIHFVPFNVKVAAVNQKGESPLSSALLIKDESPKIEINFKDNVQLTPVKTVSPTSNPKVQEVLNKIEVKESTPSSDQDSVLGVNMNGILEPDIALQKKQDQSVFSKVASFFTSILQFVTNLWK